MSKNIVSGRYAKAFFEYADPKKLEFLDGELRMAHEVLSKEESLWDFLLSPLVPQRNKIEALGKVLEVLNPAKEIITFLNLLIQKGRFYLLKEISDNFHEMVQATQNRAVCKIETAFKLDKKKESQLKDLFEKLTSKKLELKVEVNPSLIGGIVARVGEQIYDYSIQNRLQALRKTLIGV